jgi:hypothetical protein
MIPIALTGLPVCDLFKADLSKVDEAVAYNSLS